MLKDIPGLVNINPSIAPSLFVDCDLLLHFEEPAPTAWLDYSLHRRPIADVLNSTSLLSISSTSKVGIRSGRFTQAHPGGSSGSLNDSAWLTAAGDINFGASDFFMCAWVYLDGLLPDDTAGRPSMAIFSALKPFDNVHNSPWFFALTVNPSTANFFPQGVIYTGGGVTSYDASGGTTSMAGNVWTHVAFSRKGGAASDELYTYINGVITATTIVAKGAVVDAGTLGSTMVGAKDISATVGVPQVINGFNGLMDEAYINHGPGTGIGENFTPPTSPFVSTRTLRQMLGLDP
jgi:hypothetical protein